MEEVADLLRSELMQQLTPRHTCLSLLGVCICQQPAAHSEQSWRSVVQTHDNYSGMHRKKTWHCCNSCAMIPASIPKRTCLPGLHVDVWCCDMCSAGKLHVYNTRNHVIQ